MPYAQTTDGIKLYYEITGTGTPIVFVHEFAGNMKSWEPQMRHFGRQYQSICFNARGYPPSTVPKAVEYYSQAHATDDIIAVMDDIGIQKAHIVGLSMGGFAALHLGIKYPERALSLCVAGVGYGSEPDKQELFRKESKNSAEILLSKGMTTFASLYSDGPTRQPFKRSDPRGYAEFVELLGTNSAVGSANTQLGVQRERPSLYTLKKELSQIKIPTLILNGDEDTPCLEPGLMLKNTIPSAALCVLPNCGHTINLEAIDTFNRTVEKFITYVDSGNWPVYDKTMSNKTITGMSN